MTPYQTCQLVTRNGYPLADLEVSQDAGKYTIAIKAPGRNLNIPAVEVMLVTDDQGIFWAVDAKVNRVNPNGEA